MCAARGDGQKQSANFLQVIALDAPDKRYDSVYISNYALVNVLDEIKRIPGVGEAMKRITRCASGSSPTAWPSSS